MRQIGDPTYTQSAHANVGTRLGVLVWIHNDAADNVPASKSEIEGLAVRIMAKQNDDAVAVSAQLTADNASSVWSGVSSRVPTKAAIGLVDGTAWFVSADGPAGGFK